MVRDGEVKVPASKSTFSPFNKPCLCGNNEESFLGFLFVYFCFMGFFFKTKFLFVTAVAVKPLTHRDPSTSAS